MLSRRSMLKLLGLGSMSLLRYPSLYAQNKSPNILFIFIDDMGWPAISCFGNRYVSTPNIDRLANEGMKFTDGYVTPQCTPSRASLLTGQHTARNGMWHVIPRYNYPFGKVKEPDYVENLPRNTPTIGSALQACGYKTALLGKWHLTQSDDGYYTYLKDNAKQYYGFDYVNPMTDPTEYQSYGDKGVDFLTDQAIEFIENNRQQPFFIYLAHHTIHNPVLAPEEDVENYRKIGYANQGIHNSVYLGAIKHMDTAIGRLLNKLDDLGIANDTVVVFLSDNGGVDEEFDNAPLRYGKGTAYEGGIRVPLMVRWPGKVRPHTVCHTPVQVVDFFPTLLDIAGGKAPANHVLDGLSIMPLLKEQGVWKRDALYWYMPLYDILWGATPSAVIRQGDYKLIQFFGDYVDLDHGRKYIPEGRVELYNLHDDIGETRDLSKDMPERTQAMLEKLHAWIHDMGREIPGENPDYDPERWYQVVRPARK